MRIATPWAHIFIFFGAPKKNPNLCGRTAAPSRGTEQGAQEVRPRRCPIVDRRFAKNATQFRVSSNFRSGLSNFFEGCVKLFSQKVLNLRSGFSQICGQEKDTPGTYEAQKGQANSAGCASRRGELSRSVFQNAKYFSRGVQNQRPGYAEICGQGAGPLRPWVSVPWVPPDRAAILPQLFPKKSMHFFESRLRFSGGDMRHTGLRNAIPAKAICDFLKMQNAIPNFRFSFFRIVKTPSKYMRQKKITRMKSLPTFLQYEF